MPVAVPVARHLSSLSLTSSFDRSRSFLRSPAVLLNKQNERARAPTDVSANLMDVDCGSGATQMPSSLPSCSIPHSLVTLLYLNCEQMGSPERSSVTKAVRPLPSFFGCTLVARASVARVAQLVQPQLGIRGHPCETASSLPCLCQRQQKRPLRQRL